MNLIYFDHFFEMSTFPTKTLVAKYDGNIPCMALTETLYYYFLSTFQLLQAHFSFNIGKSTREKFFFNVILSLKIITKVHLEMCETSYRQNR